MSILLETTFGDLVLDLDVDGSPALCKNLLKLAKARYYSNSLIYNVVPGRYCQMGDPKGDGTGGCSIFGLIDSYQSSHKNNGNVTKKSPPDVAQSQRRFLRSQGRLLSPDELNQKGVVIAMEMGNVPHTIGSQFLITLSENNALEDLAFNAEGDDDTTGKQISLGTIAEDSQNILSKLDRAYCDDDGRPFADIRIQRALVIHDPFEDPPGMEELLEWRGVTAARGDGDKRSENDIKDGYPLAPQSPTYDRPPEEAVTVRIQADDTTLFANAGWDDKDASREYEDEDEEDETARQKRMELQEKQQEEWRKRQDTSRAVMLEMLGDRPTAEVQAPENVLFVCKLNPLTNDEDLELIFSRFDSDAKAEIIRDPDTGTSLQYAFIEFTTEKRCNEAYLKMDNALVDDRRIKVDFSQSVAHVWDRYNKKYRMGDRSGFDRGFVEGGRNNGMGRGRGREAGAGPGHQDRDNSSKYRSQNQLSYRARCNQQHQSTPIDVQEKKYPEFDSFGREVRPKSTHQTQHGHHHSLRPEGGHERRRRPRSGSRSRSRSRDVEREERRRRRSDSRERNHSSRRSRSWSDESSEYSRRRKKHRKHRRRDKSRRKRSRSHDRERKRDKKYRHRHRRGDDNHRHKSGERSRS